MSRYVGPKCKLCRREGVKLFLKGARCESSKCPLVTSQVVPGYHSKRRSKPTDYSIQLREKQKVKRIYGVPEKQFSNYFLQSRKSALNTGEQLLSRLERRLDNVVYRLGLVLSRSHGRQGILHGQFRVNGKVVKSPAFEVKSGDKIIFKTENFSERLIPDWISLDKKKKEATILDIPKRDQISEDINAQLIVEFYSR